MDQKDGKEPEKTPIEELKAQQRQLLQLSLRDGLAVGLFFVLQAFSLVIYSTGLISMLLFLVGWVGLLVKLYRVGVRYRDRERGGYVRYIEVAGHLSRVYLASMVLAFLAFYAAFHYLLHDLTFLSMMEESFALIEQVMPNSESYKMAIDSVQGITSLQLVGNLILNFALQGLIYIYIICIFIKKGSTDNRADN